jgi:predicted DNA-binding mobile mystery protein A
MNKQKLVLNQLDKKLAPFKQARQVIVPSKGWLHSIRTSLNITLRQLSDKLQTSPQNIKAVEEREASGAITLKGLREVADAMDMQLVYAIVPKDDSIEELIKRRAGALAREIVLRTSASMKLEDQENSSARLEQAINEKTLELINDLPKYLWD